MKPIEGKPVILYPCQWTFKVIGWNEKDVIAAIKEVIEPAQYQISPSKTSRQGTYVSLDLSLRVISEEARNRIYRDLADRPQIKIVM